MKVAFELPAPSTDRPAPPKAPTSGRDDGNRFEDRLGDARRRDEAAASADMAADGDTPTPRPDTLGPHRGGVPAFLFADDGILVDLPGMEADRFQVADGPRPEDAAEMAMSSPTPAPSPNVLAAAAAPAPASAEPPTDGDAMTGPEAARQTLVDVKPGRMAPAAPEAPALPREGALGALRDQAPAFDPEPAPAGGQLLQSGGAEARSQTAAPPTARPMPEMVPLDHVAVHIAKSAAKGFDKIQIHLTPASLGTIDVEVEFGRDGRVDIVVRADKPETVELLQRDARQLVRALQDTGLQADGSNLSFELRDQNSGREGAPGQAARPPGEDGGTGAGALAEPAAPQASRRVMLGGVDIIA